MADRWSLLVPEEPVEFDNEMYQARRSTSREGMPRWAIYRGSQHAPYGFLEGHECPHLHGEARLLVFDYDNRPLPFVPKPPDWDDGCVHSYKNALNNLLMNALFPE